MSDASVATASGVPGDIDILIIGSGPIGATFAREVLRQDPDRSVLMVEAGPRLTDADGQNIRNLEPGRRLEAQHHATAWTGQPTSDTGRSDGRIAARPGTFLIGDAESSEDDQTGMPAAAIAANVGGMGAHWTCACPRPGGSERISFLEDVFDEAFDHGYELLGVTQTAFPQNDAQERLRGQLSAIFDEGRAPGRRVQPMPLACTPTDAPLPQWSGVDTILAGMDPGAPFDLLADTVCLRLEFNGGRVEAAQLQDRVTGAIHRVTANMFVVAADALRTPQLLYASGIRPAALGRYLNDQPQIVSALALRESSGAEAPGTGSTDLREQLTGVLWIPFDEPGFPFHTQVMQVGTTPIEVPDDDLQHRRVVTWGRFTTKDIRAEDRIEFSDTETDPFGLPRMMIHYGLSDKDHETIARAMREMVSQAETIGDFFPGSEPRLLPAGSSLHYQGTVRMGEADDGTSVCDRNSRVWGFENLYVGGNGVIPTATACNPTATSVALAVLAARDLVERL